MIQRKANLALGLLGAGLGAAIGFMLFFVLTRMGLYALALPGAAVGLTCGWLSGGRSLPLGIVCCVIALALGIVIEWNFRPFIADDSFSYFVTHLHQLEGRTLLMLVLCGVFGFWFGIGRDREMGFSVRQRPLTDNSDESSGVDEPSDDAGTTA